jgi:ketosteroid isomerase-like protein
MSVKCKGDRFFMKTAFLVLVIALGSVACSRQAAATRDPEQAKVEIAALERRLIAAVQRKDMATLDQIWDDQYFGTAPNGRTVNKKDLMAAVEGGAIELQSLKPEDLYCRTFGDVAILTGKAKVIATVSGEDLSANVRGTGIFVNRDGAWHIAGVHVGPDILAGPITDADRQEAK